MASRCKRGGDDNCRANLIGTATLSSLGENMPLSKTFTVPVGKNVETVGVAGEMTTLKLTFWPVVLGLGDAMITDFVSLVLTVTVAEPVLAPKLPSPG